MNEVKLKLKDLEEDGLLNPDHKPYHNDEILYAMVKECINKKLDHVESFDFIWNNSNESQCITLNEKFNEIWENLTGENLENV